MWLGVVGLGPRRVGLRPRRVLASCVRGELALRFVELALEGGDVCLQSASGRSVGVVMRSRQPGASFVGAGVGCESVVVGLETLAIASVAVAARLPNLVVRPASVVVRSPRVAARPENAGMDQENVVVRSEKLRRVPHTLVRVAETLV